jgi:hypothetical protein
MMMKIHIQGAALLLALTAAILLTASCEEPVPLYGTWADNQGNRLTLIGDGTYSAAITNPVDKSKHFFEGTYKVMANVLSFSVPSEGMTIVTEWDIRGNILYISWTADDGPIALTLYKIA